VVLNNKKIRTVEELYVYQKAREFSKKIGKLINRLPDIENID